MFGGTFDPVHLGHIIVAAAAAETIKAERVVFIPAKKSVLKTADPKAGRRDRCRMINIAIAQEKDFELSDYELNKDGPDYTIETVRHFKNRYANTAHLYWLVGADAAVLLPQWYKIDELIEVCTISVMHRAGYPEPDFSGFENKFGKKHLAKLQSNVIKTPLVNISSSEIRRRLAERADVTGMMPVGVVDYIYKLGLYRK